MFCHQRHSAFGSGSTRLLILLTLIVGLLPACGGGHSSPAEPKGDILAVLSVSPPEMTVFSAGNPFHVHVVLQYHLADGPVADLRFDTLRADGSPFYPGPLPIVDFPFPLIRTDGTFPFDDQGIVPLQDVGPEVLLRFRLYSKGSVAPTATVVLHYSISR